MKIPARSAHCILLSLAFGLVGLARPIPAAEVVSEKQVTTVTKTEAQVPIAVNAPCAQTEASAVAASAVGPAGVGMLETRIDQDTVYSPISNVVNTHFPPRPAVVAPLDTLKLQIGNRINSGLVSGELTNDEADTIRSQLDDIATQEAQFKIAYGGLPPSAVANLERKYHMVNSNLSRFLHNTNTEDFMPSFTLRRAALQRLIQYHTAAGNITPAESEQLLAALNVISDNYASFRATGGTVSADELEQLHRDMAHLQAKLAERVGGTIAEIVPDTVLHRSQLLKHIQAGLAAHMLTQDEAAGLLNEYNRLCLLEQSIAANEGVRSADMAVLAQEIDNLDYLVTREVNDRAKGVARQSAVAGQSTHF